MLINISEPPQKQPLQCTAKQTLPKGSKSQPKQSAPMKKPVTQKPALKSTYSASYGRPSSAKSLMLPTSSQGSAKLYLDSVLNKDKKNGTDSKALPRKQGNVIIIWKGGTMPAKCGRQLFTHEAEVHLLLVEFSFIFFWVPLHSCTLSLQ